MKLMASILVFCVAAGVSVFVVPQLGFGSERSFLVFALGGGLALVGGALTFNAFIDHRPGLVTCGLVFLSGVMLLAAHVWSVNSHYRKVDKNLSDSKEVTEARDALRIQQELLKDCEASYQRNPSFDGFLKIERQRQQVKDRKAYIKDLRRLIEEKLKEAPE